MCVCVNVMNNFVATSVATGLGRPTQTRREAGAAQSKRERERESQMSSPTRARGTAHSWKIGDAGQNSGFGFVALENGETLFCHRTNIKDGSCLQPGVEVEFVSVPNPKHPEKRMAVDVTGGCCFDYCFRESTGGCRKGDKCKFAHVKKRDPTVEEALAAVHASRLDLAAGEPAVLIDTVDACKAACERFESERKPVAVDFEGVDLCRSGELCLAQLATVDGPVVLIDIVTLGQSAFDEGGLKALLESEDVLKLVYDGRSDADALHHLFGCGLKHVCDVQILFTLALDEERGVRTNLVPGLGRALSTCPALASTNEGKALAGLKKAVQALFVPDQGGSYEVWKERPLRPALVEYAAADVVHLHALRETWGQLCDEAEMARMAAARIEGAVHAETRAKGQHLAKRDF